MTKCQQLRAGKLGLDLRSLMPVRYACVLVRLGGGCVGCLSAATCLSVLECISWQRALAHKHKQICVCAAVCARAAECVP